MGTNNPNFGPVALQIGSSYFHKTGNLFMFFTINADVEYNCHFLNIFLENSQKFQNCKMSDIGLLFSAQHEKYNKISTNKTV